MHRGCISELCGVRQRCAGTQELESSTQEEDLKVVEYLGGKAVWEKTKLQTEAPRSSVELFQVGIEHMHSGAFEGTLL
jgi:hypothetical protein